MDFKNIKAKIKYWIDLTFHDEIVDVWPAEPHYETYRDIGKRLEGYDVRVVYKLSGETTILFPIDDRFSIITPARARHNAEMFYIETKADIQRAKNKHAKRTR